MPYLKHGLFDTLKTPKTLNISVQFPLSQTTVFSRAQFYTVFLTQAVFQVNFTKKIKSTVAQL